MSMQYDSNFLEAVRRTLKWEGGAVDDPADRGGKTRFGITSRTLSYYNQRTGYSLSLDTLDEFDVLAVYFSLYWQSGYIWEMPAWSQNIMFDWTVHSGSYRAVKLMQQAVGAKSDGMMGPKTLAAMHRAAEVHGTRGAVNNLVIRRMRHLCGIVQHDATQNRFIKGWWRRVSSFID